MATIAVAALREMQHMTLIVFAHMCMSLLARCHCILWIKMRHRGGTQRCVIAYPTTGLTSLQQRANRILASAVWSRGR